MCTRLDSHTVIVKWILLFASSFLNFDIFYGSRFSEKSKTKCIGITIETRPDYCLKKHLRFVNNSILRPCQSISPCSNLVKLISHTCSISRVLPFTVNPYRHMQYYRAHSPPVRCCPTGVLDSRSEFRASTRTWPGTQTADTR